MYPRLPTVLLATVALCAPLRLVTASAGEMPAAIQYPAACKLIDVRDFGAVGDGIHDDTDAIQRAIQSRPHGRQLYFPEGTYLVSKPLVGLNSAGEPMCWLQLYGAGKQRSRIRLKDNAIGFSDPAEPLAVLRFRGKTTSESGTSREQANVAFFNSVYDLTIDVGTGNAGAIGIDWVSCNSGSLRHVSVISSDAARAGFAGVRMSWSDGTSYIRDLTVEGFDYGFWRSAKAQSMAVEELALRGQRLAGIMNVNSVLAVHQLKSANSVPTVVQQDGIAQLTLLHAEVSGGSPTVISQVSPDAKVYLRDVRVDAGSVVVAGVERPPTPVVHGDRASVDEWFSHRSASAPGAPEQSLRLPIKPAPEYHDNDPTTWAFVEDFPDDGTGDYSVRLQRAIDSGAQTVVMSGQSKYLSRVVVRGKVRRLIGFWRMSSPPKSHPLRSLDLAIKSVGRYDEVLASVDAADPGWFMRIDDGDGSPLIIEQFQAFPGPVLNNSARTVVFRDTEVQAYANTKRATGDVFCEAVMGRHWQFRHGQKAWVRNADAVYGVGPDFYVDASQLWMLSNRTEGPGTFVEAVNGGAAEILSTTQFIGTKAKSDEPAYRSRDAQLSVVNFSEYGFNRDGVYPVLFREYANGGDPYEVGRKSSGVTRRLNLSSTMFFRTRTP